MHPVRLQLNELAVLLNHLFKGEFSVGAIAGHQRRQATNEADVCGATCLNTCGRQLASPLQQDLERRLDLAPGEAGSRHSISVEAGDARTRFAEFAVNLRYQMRFVHHDLQGPQVVGRRAASPNELLSHTAIQ